MLQVRKSITQRGLVGATALLSGWLWCIAPVRGSDVCANRASFEFRPGVVVDQSRLHMYLMNPRKVLDAVDLASGRLSWTTMRAAKPIILAGDLLIAQADVRDTRNTLRLSGLDVLKAGQVAFETDVDLPANVDASVDDGLGTSFRTQGWIDGTSIVVSWTFSRLHVGGPPPKDSDALGDKVTGAVRIDPRTGQSRLLVPGESASPPAPVSLAMLGRHAGSGAPPGPLWSTGSVVAATRRTPGNRTPEVVLVRWNCATGEAMPEVVLFGADYTLRYPSADQKHLLASKQDRGARPPWHWLIFSIDSGTRVAEINMESAGARFFIWGDRLLYEAPPEQRQEAGKIVEEPLRLVAVDLGNGRELWNWPIRDTAYRGPYPPRR